MKDMKAVFNTIVAIERVEKCVVDDIKKDFNENNEKAIRIFINAYNEWQENEKDGVDYIFNINNQNDLECVVKGGMTAKEIAELTKSSSNGFFFFGCNYPTPKAIGDEETLKNVLLAYAYEVVEFVLAYPFAPNAQQLYQQYITNYINPLNIF